jgi:flavin-dependent halogenase
LTGFESQAPMSASFDAVVIGGGPAGSAVARVLASWGHSVLVLTKAADAARGAAESIPPSTRKLLATIGMLEQVEAAGFFRTTGNTVWWAAREVHVEPFGSSGDTGYQVHRPEFDRILLGLAAKAGADVVTDARVRGVRLDNHAGALVTYQRDGRATATVNCRFAVDASGRAGVIARRGLRRYEPGFLTQAFIGEWQRDGGWDLPDDSHTLVETYAEGWAWSVPLSRTVRHVGVAIDGATTRARRGPTLQSTYRTEIGKTKHVGALMAGATLGRVWACDASLYSSHCYAGPNFLLLGDAASTIDPLSSFGVKKALASAWVGAVAVHTSLTHPDHEAMALDFFSNRERQVYAAGLRRSWSFAHEAFARHAHPFWAERAGAGPAAAGEIDEDELFRAPDVQAAFRWLKHTPALELELSSTMEIRQCALIRGREIVSDEALSLPEAPDGIRFLAGVDLLKLGEMACHHHQVPDLFEAYCRIHGAVPLPSFLGSLSVLLARGVLRSR